MSGFAGGALGAAGGGASVAPAFGLGGGGGFAPGGGVGGSAGGGGAESGALAAGAGFALAAGAAGGVGFALASPGAAFTAAGKASAPIESKTRGASDFGAITRPSLAANGASS